MNFKSIMSNSWPAEGRPRPKVPNLGEVYMLPEILRAADKIDEPYCNQDQDA